MIQHSLCLTRWGRRPASSTWLASPPTSTSMRSTDDLPRSFTRCKNINNNKNKISTRSTVDIPRLFNRCHLSLFKSGFIFAYYETFFRIFGCTFWQVQGYKRMKNGWLFGKSQWQEGNIFPVSKSETFQGDEKHREARKRWALPGRRLLDGGDFLLAPKASEASMGAFYFRERVNSCCKWACRGHLI